MFHKKISITQVDVVFDDGAIAVPAVSTAVSTTVSVAARRRISHLWLCRPIRHMCMIILAILNRIIWRILTASAVQRFVWIVLINKIKSQ